TAPPLDSTAVFWFELHGFGVNRPREPAIAEDLASFPRFFRANDAILTLAAAGRVPGRSASMPRLASADGIAGRQGQGPPGLPPRRPRWRPAVPLAPTDR